MINLISPPPVTTLLPLQYDMLSDRVYHTLKKNLSHSDLRREDVARLPQKKRRVSNPSAGNSSQTHRELHKLSINNNASGSVSPKVLESALVTPKVLDEA